MNADDVMELVDKVLQADKTIHDQLLGWTWLPPTVDVFAGEQDATTVAEKEAAEKAKEAAAHVDEQMHQLRTSAIFAPMLTLVAEEVRTIRAVLRRRLPMIFAFVSQS